MKNALITLVLLSSVSAFAGHKFQVCVTNEDGTEYGCRTVESKRELGVPSSQGNQVYCDGDGQNTVCPKPDAHVPKILVEIGEYFKARGFKAPNFNQDAEFGD